MIECIFTIDYEIYGNGEGSLRELVFEPTEKLKGVFKKWDASFVTFVEAAELETIERHHADDAVGDIRKQIVELYGLGHEIGLHVHPQWCNAQYRNGAWLLDYSEYNLCSLSKKRISDIIQSSIEYLRGVLNKADFSPLAFRAGNWLLQPTDAVSGVLVEKGIKIDSSVFKGGLQHNLGLDYRPALKNGYYWRFQNDVNIHDPNGRLIELPTYSVMVPSWKMVTSKRIGMGRKGISSSLIGLKKFTRYLDFLRFRYPLKMDFCRMTLSELTTIMDNLIREDRRDPTSLRPVVAIGHTKDLVDLETVDSFLSYLRDRGIAVTTFEKVYSGYLQ